MKTLIIKRQDEAKHRDVIKQFRVHGWIVVIR